VPESRDRQGDGKPGPAFFFGRGPSLPLFPYEVFVRVTPRFFEFLSAFAVNGQIPDGTPKGMSRIRPIENVLLAANCFGG
jgi:hypothetical protein